MGGAVFQISESQVIMLELVYTFLGLNAVISHDGVW